MAPSNVNNAMRATNAAVREWYENADWVDFGDTPTYASSTTFTISGDVTARYHANRRIRATDATTLYGTISSSSYSAPNTTVTVTLDSGSLSASLTAVAIGATKTNDAEPRGIFQLYDANNAVTDAAQTFTAGQRGEITTLTDGATITPDMADSNNFVVTLGGNRTLANPSNLTAGQSGSIFIVQDGTGSRTLSFGSQYDFAAGTAPTLTTTASAVDRIDYVVRTTSSIHCVATLNYS